MALTAAPADAGTVIAYQWYAGAADVSSGGALIPGATGTALTVTLGAPETVYYYCGVSCTVGAYTFAFNSGTTAVTPVSGGGAYLIVSDGGGAYTGGFTGDGIPTLTVNPGVTGLTYFGADITPVTGHAGPEVCVFVQLRGGQQIGFSASKGDYDTQGARTRRSTSCPATW